MVKASAKPAAEIQRLLDERHRIEQWLERLSVAADNTPEPVRERVAADYRARLEAVIGELQGHRDELEASLEAHVTRREELRREEREHRERLAEAELRHTVGEYDEGRWSEIGSEIQKVLDGITERLEAAEAEIATLEKVLALLQPAGAVSEPPAPQERRSAGAAGMGSPVAAAPSVEPDPESPSEVAEDGQTDAFDELAFLKSVTGEGHAVSPDAGPVSGGGPGEPGDLGADAVEPLAASARAPERSTAKKTLKCVECGTMNLATEWYCERCGAELAAL